MDYEEFLKGKGIDFEIMYFPSPVRTVSQASEASGFPEDVIIKTVILKGRKNYAVIVKGRKRIDMERFREMDGEARLASPEEVTEITGFPPGAVPPIMDADVVVFMDREIAEMPFVVGGGGKENALLKVSVKDLIEIMKPNMIEI